MQQKFITDFKKLRSSKPPEAEAKKRSFQDIKAEIIKDVFGLFPDQQNDGDDNTITQSKPSEENKTNATPKRSNKKYTEEQKQGLVKLVPYMTYAEIERRFKIDEATLRGWVRNGVKKDGRSLKSGQKPVLDVMEKKLAQKLGMMRDEGKLINANIILLEAKVEYGDV